MLRSFGKAARSISTTAMAQARHDSPLLRADRPHRVLIVGGSYGGLSFLVNLLDHIDGKPVRPSLRPLPDFAGKKSQRGVEVTLLDERDGWFHTVGAPLAHTTKQHVVPFWKEYSAFRELKHPALTIERGRIEQIDCESKVATYSSAETGEKRRHEYDHVLMATGLSREWPIVPESHRKDRYVMDALQHINTLAASNRVVVIGGGAVGIEVAGEMKVNNPAIDVTLVHSRDRLLSNEPLPEEFTDRALQVLKEEGVEVIMGQRATVHETADGKIKRVELTDGTVIDAGAVINATTKSAPNTTSLPTAALDADGYVKVTPNLNFPDTVPNSKSHFAIGDITVWSGIKRAGAAMYMGQHAASNIFSQILSSEDKEAEFGQSEFPVVPVMMALAVGKQAIGYGGPGSEITAGKETMAAVFGEDLGWTSGIRFLRLTDVNDEIAKAAVKVQ